MPNIDGPRKIIENISSNFSSLPVKNDRGRNRNYPVIPIQVHGITDATVKFWASCSSEQEIREGTAIWSPIENGEFTRDVATGLFVVFPHIRIEVLNFVSGSITVFMDI